MDIFVPLYLFLDLCFQWLHYIPIAEQARTLCPCKGPFLDNIFDLRPSAFATLIVIMIEPMCSFLKVNWYLILQNEKTMFSNYFDRLSCPYF